MQQVLKDSTDTLLVYPPRLIDGRVPGVPSSVTIRIGTTSTTLPAVGSGDAVTVDAVSASTNAAASEGDLTLAFASDPTLTAGRFYLVENTLGERAWLRAIKTGTTSRFASPLPFDCASGSTIKGILCPHALTAAETSSIGEGIAFARATMDGVEREWGVRFEIVRQIFQVPLSAAELIERRPEVLRLRSPTDVGFDEIIQSAWLDYVRPELNARGMHDERIRSGDALIPALLDAVVYRLCLSHYSDDVAMLDRREREYRETLARVLGSSKFWYDEANDSVDLDADRGPKALGSFTRQR